MPTSPDATSLSKPHTFPTPDQPTHAGLDDTSTIIPTLRGAGEPWKSLDAVLRQPDADPPPPAQPDGTFEGGSRPGRRGTARGQREGTRRHNSGSARAGGAARGSVETSQTTHGRGAPRRGTRHQHHIRRRAGGSVVALCCVCCTCRARLPVCGSPWGLGDEQWERSPFGPGMYACTGQAASG